MKRLFAILFLGSLACLGCSSAQVAPPAPMSLADALTDVTRALNAMSEVQTSEKHGLVPAEVTVTLQLTAGKKEASQAAIEVLPLGAVAKLGGSYTAEVTSSTGNQIVIKFRSILFANGDELVSRKTPGEIDELLRRLRELGWNIKGEPHQ